ncbi:hypothetical protein FAGAP_7802 [Fusarium agapanthi]|uniref:Uncharacterized protein n=1 Tax=Fusarium agapanthi TaxID=1803897 RepID=A0A9P5B702_9HYPO|nr:hypothetical protein FAGAP_7802 [Fusarium agapanthi]
MDEWGRVAAITALVTIPIYASAFLLQPFFQKVKDTLLRLYLWNRTCEAIQWSHILQRPIQTQWYSLEVGNQSADTQSPKNKSLIRFLYNVWQVKSTPAVRPAYLDMSKDYLLLDADVLLGVVLLLGCSGTLGRQPDPGARLTLNFASTTAQFRVFECENNFFLIGKLMSVPLFETIGSGYQGTTKGDLRAVSSGYPPFYRFFLRVNAGYEIAHPTEAMRDVHRADWILAIGFSSSTTEPLKLYRKQQLRAYTGACTRVLDKLRWLQGELSLEAGEPHRQLLDVAVRVVAHMNSFKTGSGAGSVTKGTVLLADHGTIGRSLKAPDIIFALKLFKEYASSELGRYDRETLERILEDVLRAAVYGVFTWWQYVNNVGQDIPPWLLDDRVRLSPVWLEDDGES